MVEPPTPLRLRNSWPSGLITVWNSPSSLSTTRPARTSPYWTTTTRSLAGSGPGTANTSRTRRNGSTSPRRLIRWFSSDSRNGPRSRHSMTMSRGTT